MSEGLDRGASGEPPFGAVPVDVPLTPRVLRVEVLMVLAVGLGPGLIEAIVLLARYLIGGREAIVSFSRIPGHPWADSGLQILLAVAAGVVVLVVGYVLMRSGESLRAIGLTFDRPFADLGYAIALTIVLLVCAVAVSAPLHAVGIHSIGATSRVLEHWPYEPARIVDSIRTALVEEVIVCGYLLHRLRQLGWSNNRALLASMAVRCSYHVYGGVLLVVFTILFGFLMGRLYQRSRRLTAIIGAHALYDATVFTIAIAVNVHRHH